jgi:hypothetical protein
MTLYEKFIFTLPLLIVCGIAFAIAWVKLLPIIDEMTGANDEVDHE